MPMKRKIEIISHMELYPDNKLSHLKRSFLVVPNVFLDKMRNKMDVHQPLNKKIVKKKMILNAKITLKAKILWKQRIT
jgi:hypothetical protein